MTISRTLSGVAYGRLALVLSAALGLAGCAGDDVPDPAGQASASGPLRVAPGAFAEGTPVDAPDAVTAAARVLGTRADLRLSSVRQSLTGEHVRYQQIAPDGTEVLDGEVSVHFLGSAPSYRLAKLWDLPAAPRLSGSRALPERAAGETALALARQQAAAHVFALDSIAPAALAVDADGHELRAGWRVRVASERPVHLWEIWVDGETGAASLRRDLVWHAEGSGMVFLPNPMTSTGDLSMTDNNDATTPALDAARIAVTLPRLDGTGLLKGDFVDVRNKDNTRVSKPDLNFDFDRSQDEFEEVNAYYQIDLEASFVEQLGFTGARAILHRPLPVLVNTFTDDNSFFTVTGGPHLETGTGGVDDAEDGDGLHHEYGHAMQNDMVPNYGQGFDAGSLGECFGDIMAASMPTGAPVMIDRACVAPWDATSYSSTNPPCLRRVDGHKHYPEHVGDPNIPNLPREVHADGEIYSAAIWDIYQQTGLGSEKGLRLVIEAFFSVTRSVTFEQYSQALIATDVALSGGQHVDTIKKILWRRGVLRAVEPAGQLSGGFMTQPFSLAQTHLGDVVDEETTIHQDGATAIRLHFAAFDMQTDLLNPNCFGGNCDNVYLYDAAGKLYAILGGKLGKFDAPVVPGDTVVVRWVTDRKLPSGGFSIDRYAWSGAGPGTPDAGPDAGASESGDGGCGCRTAGSAGAGAGGGLVLLGLAGVLLTRRRTRRRP